MYKKGFFKLPLAAIIILALSIQTTSAQNEKLNLRYILSLTNTSKHYFHVELSCSGWLEDTLTLKMPQWMPGYYQIMDYAKAVENFSVKDNSGKELSIINPKINTWKILSAKNKMLKISYDVIADKQFVANNFLDSTHGYIITAGTLLYIDRHINTPVSVKLIMNTQWKTATGLEPVQGTKNEFSAPDFDVLYDCPILAGNLEKLPSFRINNIEHRFIGYKPGNFDKVKFMSNLKKMVEAASSIIGDIPYKQYTFIAIGPGRGGIEHLNNTTVGFRGEDLNTPDGMNKMMSFLAHEYFHHYNVKRIRPFELGPFDYDKENRTNLLWVSEGLSVYYEYLIIKRAGLIDEKTLLSNFEKSINAFEDSPGKLYESLAQASYETWSEGPFGRQGDDADKHISYYDKGPAVGMILDFEIRHATQNRRSLDDVMRMLYWKYYKELKRGFTDAEFQETCEIVAGTSLSKVFEYVNTAKQLDYNAYFR
ncbi:MAG: M61 family metallopeptidase, partial [Bacteroidetes bacterium]|nr:M61 family metallopeptidase [Bacteroidota bacterium]